MEPVRITRERNYPSRAHPGPAWVYVYTVQVPGLDPMKGRGIGWAVLMAQKHGPDRRIVYGWKG